MDDTPKSASVLLVRVSDVIDQIPALTFPSLSILSERSSPSRVRSAAQNQRALDRCGPF
jgi:hypothetical protein